MGGKGSGYTKERRLVDNYLGRKRETVVPAGEEFIVPNHSGDHSAGRVDSTPVNDFDIANKKYVDDNTTSLPLSH